MIEINGRKKLKQTLRQGWLERSMIRQNGRCHYCLCRMHRERGHHDGIPPWWPTNDHIIPRAEGGLDREENTVAACYRCNHRKGDLMPWDFLPIIAEERERQEQIIRWNAANQQFIKETVHVTA